MTAPPLPELQEEGTTMTVREEHTRVSREATINGLLLLMLVLCAVGCGPPKSSRSTGPAFDIAGKYPPLTGKLAAKIASGEVCRLVEAEKLEFRTKKQQDEKGQLHVREYILDGEVVWVRTYRRVPVAVLADVKAGDVTRIDYGPFHRWLSSTTKTSEIAAVLECLKKDSYAYDISYAFRPFRDEKGQLHRENSLRLQSFEMWKQERPTWGLCLRKAGGGSRSIFHDKPGKTVRFSMPVFGPRGCFRNDRLFDVLREMASKRGVKLELTSPKLPNKP
jgi:hypothetical protein